MKELILKRIEEIKNNHQGFKKGTMRWDNFSTGTDKTHISEMNFEELDDNSLLLLFERLIKRHYTQM